MQFLEVRALDDFGLAFAAATRGRAEALIIGPSSFFFAERRRIIDLVTKSRLPAMFASREAAEAGGLMSYGPSISDAYGRAAYYVDRILKGAKPAELPVEQPKKFELVLNLKTAGALGRTFPPTLLILADEVLK
jgi:putative ABC transport system substrate-binding protein